MKIKDPEILKTWVLSTGHITFKDSELLDECNKPPYAEVLSAGWRVIIDVDDNNDLNSLDLKERGFSPEFISLLEIAHEMGVNWIEFDRDGIEYADQLPIFDW